MADVVARGMAGKAMKGVEAVATANLSYEVQGLNLIVKQSGTEVCRMTFSQPKDGVSVSGCHIDSDYNLYIDLDDGSSQLAGKLPSGKDGHTPEILPNGNWGINGTDTGVSATGGNVDLSGYYKKTETYSKTEVDTKLDKSYKKTETYNKTEVDTKLDDYIKEVDVDTKLADYEKTIDVTTKISNHNTSTTAHDDIRKLIGLLSDLTVTGVSDIVGAINKLDKQFMQSITLQNKTITLVYKNGVTFDIDVSPIITDTSVGDLMDVDISGITNGQAIVWDVAVGKFIPTTITGTDEKVKINSSDTTAHYLSEILDSVTLTINASNKLEVQKLNGQEVTIDEINMLKGIKSNIQETLDLISNGNLKVYGTPFATKSDLDSLDLTSLTDNVVYLCYVVSDEEHDNLRTSYLVSKDNGIKFFGVTEVVVRDFTTDPIDLVSEVKGKLQIANIDTDAILALLNYDDEYKTVPTEVKGFSNVGANAMYTELSSNIGKKVNISDIVDGVTSEAVDKPASANTAKQLADTITALGQSVSGHIENTDIHPTLAKQSEWDDKISSDSLVVEFQAAPDDTHIASEKLVKDNLDKKVNVLDIIDNLTSTDYNKPLSAKQGNALHESIELMKNTIESHEDNSDIHTTLVEKQANADHIADVDIHTTLVEKQANAGHIADTDIHVTKELKDKLLTTDDITTNIDSSSTNAQIPGAKIINDMLGSKYGKQPSTTLNDYTTVLEWAKNNIGNSVGYTGNNFEDSLLKTEYGTLVCLGNAIDTGLLVIAFRNWNETIYVRKIKGSNIENATWITEWERVCTTKVANVPKTTITFSDTTNYEPFDANNNSYEVIDGVCYISLFVKCINPSTTSWISVINSLPKAKIQELKTLGAWNNVSDSVGCAINTSGELKLHGGTAGGEYIQTFSYRVEE